MGPRRKGITKHYDSIRVCFLIFIVLIISRNTYSQNVVRTNLWEEGKGGYGSYRIPSLIVASNGTLLAFAEGRKKSGDSGNIDLLLRRSEDNGKTWLPEQVVWDDSTNTCGNPTPVVDEQTGRIWLFMTWNRGDDSEGEIIQKKSKDTRRVFLSYSDDNGETWSNPRDVTSQTKKLDWGWYATGPGVGIQLKHGKYKGRLIIPADHSFDKPDGKHYGNYGYGAHVIISDDHGKTWRISEPVEQEVNENQIVELPDGTLMMNARNYNDKHSRAVAYSKDGGDTWSDIIFDYQLVESKCQGSILNFGNYHGRNMLLFSNPAVPVGRTHMTIKTSFDNGKSWSNAKLITAGPAAYSCLTKLPNGNIGLFYEMGESNAYQTMQFISFPPGELFSAGTLKQ